MAPMPGPAMQPVQTAGPPQGYASGVDAVAGAQGGAGMEQAENPVVAGIRSIMLFAKALKDKGDPRAEPVIQHLTGLVQSMGQGAPEQAMPQQPPQQQGPQGMGFDPFSAPQQEPGGAVPMGGAPKPEGKQPVILS